MKRCVLLIFIFLFFGCEAKLFAQPKSEAEAKEMAQKLRRMTPAQIMKFRDSMMNAVLHKEAKALPNGDQLLIKHHYDTTYTTVRFFYTKKVSESHTMGGNSGSSVYLCSGKSLKAPMIYEANGHTIVACGMNPPGVNTEAIDEMAGKLNNGKKYLTANQATKNQDIAAQMAFSSMAIKDNSITGTASENSNYSSSQGHLSITTKPPVTRMGFSFTYDPVTVTSTVSVGATINIHTVGVSYDAKGNPTSSSRDDVTNVGMSAATDPHFAKMVGLAAPPAIDPDKAYITVAKTARGFKITYTSTQYLQQANAHITETLMADIGEPDQQFEAVIKPLTDCKYPTWLPKGPMVDGRDDTKGDDSLKFYVIVRDKNDTTKMYPGTYTVKYHLTDVTRYKGFNSNYPVTAATDAKDLKICDSVRLKEGHIFDLQTLNDSIAISKPGKGDVALLQITCMDYGAWGRLTADVTLDNGTQLVGRPFYDPEKTSITIPFDIDENKIADHWEKSEHIMYQGYGLNWDEDVKPDNGNPGDGIALIDEYRGFLTEDGSFNRIYKRFSPQKKELITIGLADLSRNGAAFKQQIKDGAMGYGNASGVVIYHLTNSKYGQQENSVSNISYGRWINYNSPLAKHSYGVVIYADDGRSTDPNSAKALASTIPTFGDGGPGFLGNMTPEDTKEIHIWTVYIINDVPFKNTEFMPDHPEGIDDPFEQRMFANIAATNEEFHVHIDPNHASPLVTQYTASNIQHIITYTVAHELGHATNIHHHSAANPGPQDANYYGGSPNCIMRYWMDNKYIVNCRTWMQMWIFGLWNPASFRTPDNAGSIKLCRSGDDCFHQMKLKKN